MKKRVISIFTLMIMVFSLNICGCGNSAVKNTADVYCDLLLKHEAKNAKKIGFSDSDIKELKKEYEDELKSTLNENIVGLGYTPTDSESNEQYEMYKNAYAKVDYSIDNISKSGNEAEVEISTNYFDLNAIEEKATIDTIDEVNKMKFTDNDEENKKYAQIYLSKFTEGLKNAKTVKDRKKLKFAFKREGKEWAPKDSENFGYQLTKMAAGSKHPELKMNEEIAKPEECAQAYWNLMVGNDSSALVKLGKSKELGAKLIERRNNWDYRDLKSVISEENILSEEQMQKLTAAFESAKSKNTPKIEVVSRQDDSVEIKITSTVIDMDAMFKEIEKRIASQAIAQGVSDEKGIAAIVCADLIEDLNNAKPSTVTKSHTFTFGKEEDLWVPEDLSEFNYDLQDLCMSAK